MTPDEKAEQASRIVGKPYSPEQAKADEMLLPVIGKVVKEIEYEVNFIRGEGCYDFTVEIDEGAL